MQPLRIEGATRRIAEDQDEYFALSIKDDVVDGLHVMMSTWEPTPTEARHIAEGGSIMVEMLTSGGESFIAYLAQPQEDERQALAAGGTCVLAVPGQMHPPVLITTVPRDRARKLIGPAQPAVAVGVRRAPELV